jgi:hypothetical protein
MTFALQGKQQAKQSLMQLVQKTSQRSGNL